MVASDWSLNEMDTSWTDVSQAHCGEPATAHAARSRLILRYIGPVRRYVLAITRDPEVADELTQEFALRALRGGFKGAARSRGRFRDLVRTAARNLVHDYYRRSKTRPVTLPAQFPEPAGPRDDDEPDEPSLRSWRTELHHRARAALAAHQQRTGQPFHEVLRLRIDHPELTSAQMADQLSRQLGRPVKDGYVRQILRRAREKYVDLLLDEVAASLHEPTAEHLEQELMVLGLLDYCRVGLRRRMQIS
jgi:RNA polymerase sigma-70 factor (ECF subfamily)